MYTYQEHKAATGRLNQHFLLYTAESLQLSATETVLGSEFRKTTGCRLQVAGCRLQVAGCRFLVPGSWFLVPGSWLLVAGCWLLVAGYLYVTT